MNQGQEEQEEHRRRSERWDRVPINFLRPVDKRTMAEVVHMAATRLVWQRREYILVRHVQECTRKKPGGQEVAVAFVFVRQGCHSTSKRSPSNSDGCNTTCRALRREWVGPRERPA